MKNLVSHRLFWSAVVLAALLVASFLSNHSCFHYHRAGRQFIRRTVDILRRAAPIVLVALGMTLVIATRGIDLSVGAIAAICGSWASMYIISSADRASVGVVLTAVGVALLMALLAGGRNPKARSSIQEVTDAGVVRFFGPFWLVHEVDDNIPSSRNTWTFEASLRVAWTDYRPQLHLFRADPVAGVDVVDPKDLPYAYAQDASARTPSSPRTRTFSSRTFPPF